MNCARTGVPTTQLDCHVCNWCEREAVKATARFKSILYVQCLHCKTIYDHKDGLGQIGITSGVCPSCRQKGLNGFI